MSLELIYPGCDELIEKTYRWAERPGNHIIFKDSSEYPELLKTIFNPPEVLYLKGDVNLLKEPQIAIVGSRQMSAYGRENAQAFAAFLSQAGMTITSGLALGIDACAHESTLKVRGSTIAVLATGIDLCYPRGHEKLVQEISIKGAVISECPLGTPPLKTGFPRRNRIISGLSMGVLVVEAALPSGSLLTAKAALEQGREVFAIPGSIHQPLSKGCHALLKMGAKCVESGADILEECRGLLMGYLQKPREFQDLKELSQLNGVGSHGKRAALDPDYQCVLKVVGVNVTRVEDILQATGLEPRVVASILLMLELEGWIEQAHGGYVRLKE